MKPRLDISRFSADPSERPPTAEALLVEQKIEAVTGLWTYQKIRLPQRLWTTCG